MISGPPVVPSEKLAPPGSGTCTLPSRMPSTTAIMKAKKPPWSNLNNQPSYLLILAVCAASKWARSSAMSTFRMRGTSCTNSTTPITPKG